MTDINDLIKENLKKKLEIEGKLLDHLIKIMDGFEEKGTIVDISTLQTMINFLEIKK